MYVEDECKQGEYELLVSFLNIVFYGIVHLEFLQLFYLIGIIVEVTIKRDD